MNAKATAILTNYSRPDNINKIVSCLRDQTASIEIILIDNSDIKNNYDVDLQVSVSKNLMCFPRWFFSNYATASYIFTLDDDLMFSDDNVVADCIKYSKENGCAIGGFGVVLNNFDYWKSSHVKANAKTSFEVSIVKGRFFFTPKDFLKNVPLIAPDAISYETPRFEDDIFVSSYINKKIIPTFLAGRLTELPEGEFSLWKQPDHRESRRIAATKFFNKK